MQICAVQLWQTNLSGFLSINFKIQTTVFVKLVSQESAKKERKIPTILVVTFIKPVITHQKSEAEEPLSVYVVSQ